MKGMPLTSIYLAGKISKNDWRPFVDYSDYDYYEPLPDWEEVDASFQGLRVTGPFFMSCDHGCAHGNGSHASIVGCSGEEGESRRRTWRRCVEAIKRADIFFAWLDDDTTAFGTLVEIGYAKALGKRIVIGAPRRLSQDHLATVVYDRDTDDDAAERMESGEPSLEDLWFAMQCADTVLVAPTPEQALSDLAALPRRRYPEDCAK